MARPVNPAIEKRNQELISYFKTCLGEVGLGKRRALPRNAELTSMFGMSEQMIQRTLAAAGLVGKEHKRPKQEMENLRAISNLHMLIGIELERSLHALIIQGDIPSGSLTDMGTFLKITPMRLSAIFKGLKDPTLTELVLMCKSVGLSLGEVVIRAQQKEQAICRKSNSPGISSSANFSGEVPAKRTSN